MYAIKSSLDIVMLYLLYAGGRMVYGGETGLIRPLLPFSSRLPAYLTICHVVCRHPAFFFPLFFLDSGMEEY